MDTAAPPQGVSSSTEQTFLFLSAEICLFSSFLILSRACSSLGLSFFRTEVRKPLHLGPDVASLYKMLVGMDARLTKQEHYSAFQGRKVEFQCRKIEFQKAKIDRHTQIFTEHNLVDGDGDSFMGEYTEENEPVDNEPNYVEFDDTDL